MTLTVIGRNMGIGEFDMGRGCNWRPAGAQKPVFLRMRFVMSSASDIECWQAMRLGSVIASSFILSTSIHVPLCLSFLSVKVNVTFLNEGPDLRLVSRTEIVIDRLRNYTRRFHSAQLPRPIYEKNRKPCRLQERFRFHGVMVTLGARKAVGACGVARNVTQNLAPAAQPCDRLESGRVANGTSDRRGRCLCPLLCCALYACGSLEACLIASRASGLFHLFTSSFTVTSLLLTSTAARAW